MLMSPRVVRATLTPTRLAYRDRVRVFTGKLFVG